MRKKLLYICGILWIFALFQMIRNYEEEQATDIVTAFTNDMYLNTVSSVKGMALYGNVYLEEEAKEQILKDAADRLGIQEPYKITTEVRDGGGKLVLTKEATAVRTSISLITTETPVGQLVVSQKHYISVEMEIDNSLESAVYYRQVVKELFEDMDLGADVYLYMKGNIEGDMSNSEKNSIADHIIENMGGKVVTENRGADIFTIYAYAEDIEDYVVYGSAKTNINVVIAYNEITGMTEVYMATPILNEDY